MSWYIQVLRKYAVASGRARRKEYWMFILVNTIIQVAMLGVDAVLGTTPVLYYVYGLAVVLPGWAVAVRRLHDTDHSGWWLLIAMVPLIGAVVLFVFLASRGVYGANRYGPSPLMSEARV